MADSDPFSIWSDQVLSAPTSPGRHADAALHVMDG